MNTSQKPMTQEVCPTFLHDVSGQTERQTETESTAMQNDTINEVTVSY